MFDIPTAPTRVHYLFQENAEALQNAALLLGGLPWLKRVQNLFETLWTENSLHGRVGREFNALHRLLTLVHVNDPSRPEAAYFAAIDPMSPHLEEISLLADQLCRAFEEAATTKVSTAKRRGPKMNETAISEDRLQSRIETALDTSNKTLQAIDFAVETEALEGELHDDVLNLKERIDGLAIFATDEHFAVIRVADRLEPIILAATTVHYISAEEWNINPPSEEKTVERSGLAAIDLRSPLRDLAEQLAAIQNTESGADCGGSSRRPGLICAPASPGEATRPLSAIEKVGGEYAT